VNDKLKQADLILLRLYLESLKKITEKSVRYMVSRPRIEPETSPEHEENHGKNQLDIWSQSQESNLEPPQ
jgi:hypothetical protein